MMPAERYDNLESHKDQTPHKVLRDVSRTSTLPLHFFRETKGTTAHTVRA
jgi:hypothetical protein